MLDKREPGATFALGDIGFVDFESTGALPIEVGTDRYARNAKAVILVWAIGEGPIGTWAVKDFSQPLDWRDAPRELVEFFTRVERGAAVLCAHHATFDRYIWAHATRNFPSTEPWMWIDSRVQASTAGLPADLATAARYSGASVQKDAAGKQLIKLFCLPESTATPQSHPDDWAAFIRYAGDDIGSMRELFRRTRQLPLAEWEEYWAAENVNDIGVAIDVPLAAAAAAMAEKDKALSRAELDRLTNGAVKTVDSVKKIIAWLWTVLPAEGRDMLVKRYEEIDEAGEITKPAKNSLTRDRVVRLIAYLEGFDARPGPLSVALRVLQIRLYGGSKTPAKFSKMLSQQVGGVIRCQYTFSGAGQTGRYSARGVQVHNLARDSLKYEMDAIDALTGGAEPEDFELVGDKETPTSRKLSLLIRPTLIAQPSRAFAWGDWSNIEARLVPYLADDPEAEQRLDIFRAVDDGREKYDIYTRTAATLSKLDLHEVTPEIRQRGKVVELAAGFGGSTNALLSMAASYKMHLTEEEAKAAISRWREANPWAVRFWGAHGGHNRSHGLWGALNTAIENPYTRCDAGRVGYVFLPGYLGGSLLCELPSGRWLTYRRIKWELVDIEDDDGNVIEQRRELMFARDKGRIKLWPGLACENVVQATAADILRGTLVVLDEPQFGWMPTRLHTHDEIVVEAQEDDAHRAANTLREVMEFGFNWSAGLPIAAETVVGRFYSKNKGSLGL